MWNEDFQKIMEEKIAAIESKIDEYDKKIIDSHMKIAELKKVIDELNRENSELKKTLAAEIQARKKLSQELEVMKNTLKSKTEA